MVPKTQTVRRTVAQPASASLAMPLLMMVAQRRCRRTRVTVAQCWYNHIRVMTAHRIWVTEAHRKGCRSPEGHRSAPAGHMNHRVVPRTVVGC